MKFPNLEARRLDTVSENRPRGQLTFALALQPFLRQPIPLLPHTAASSGVEVHLVDTQGPPEAVLAPGAASGPQECSAQLLSLPGFKFSAAMS